MWTPAALRLEGLLFLLRQTLGSPGGVFIDALQHKLIRPVPNENLNLLILFYVYVYCASCLCTLCRVRCLWRPEEGIGSSRTGISEGRNSIS